MYNRYTPGQDGSYRRNRVPDAAEPPQLQQTSPSQEIPEAPKADPEPTAPPRQQEDENRPMNFLTGLLPKDMDKGDLLVLLILLLLLSDGTEDAANPLLTLALFLLMK